VKALCCAVLAMKVNHSYLVSALHIEGASDVGSTQALASSVLDYLYTEAGYRAFVALVSSLAKSVPSFIIPIGDQVGMKGSSSAGIEEDYFATLMRKLTDLRDWQIVDLFDLFDRYGDGVIRTRDLFVLVALIVSADARRSTLVFYLHRKEIFEILSRRAVPHDIDGDDDGDEDEAIGEKEVDGEDPRGKKSPSASEAGSEARGRPGSGSTHSNASPAAGDNSSTSPSANTSSALMTFAQFCGVGTPVGVPPSRLIAILEKFGVHEGGMFSYQDYLVYGYWVLSHVDAQDDDAAPAGSDEQQQQQAQVGGDSQTSRFCIVM